MLGQRLITSEFSFTSEQFLSVYCPHVDYWNLPLFCIPFSKSRRWKIENISHDCWMKFFRTFICSFGKNVIGVHVLEVLFIQSASCSSVRGNEINALFSWQATAICWLRCSFMGVRISFKINLAFLITGLAQKRIATKKRDGLRATCWGERSLSDSFINCFLWWFIVYCTMIGHCQTVIEINFRIFPIPIILGVLISSRFRFTALSLSALLRFPFHWGASGAFWLLLLSITSSIRTGGHGARLGSVFGQIKY